MKTSIKLQWVNQHIVLNKEVKTTSVLKTRSDIYLINYYLFNKHIQYIHYLILLCYQYNPQISVENRVKEELNVHTV